MSEVRGELVERASEMRELALAADRSAAGNGGLAVIEGAAGIGKTALVEAARPIAAEAGLRRLAARAGDLEQDFPYGVARQLFERALADAGDEKREELLSGPADRAGIALGITAAGHDLAEGALLSADGGFAAMHGLYWLVSNLAADSPLLLEVDDVHWADAPTLRFLIYLAARLDGLPVMLVVASRPGEPTPQQDLVAKLCADPAAIVLRPPPLSPTGVEAIAASRTGEVPAASFAAACHESTGGNPFYLSELLSALAADGVKPDDSGAAQVHGVGPETISRSLLLRLSSLPPGSGALARAIAVMGARAESRHAARLAGLSDAEAGTAADALAAVGILEPDQPLRFAHPVMRESIYCDIPGAERTELHGAAASILREAGANAAAVAPHLLATEPSGDPGVPYLLAEAADGAFEQGAADIAARYLRRALSEPPPQMARAGMLAALGTAEWLAGEDPLAPIRNFEDALNATVDPATRADRALGLARAVLAVGDIPRAVSLLEDEIAAHGDEIDPQTTIALEVELASLGIQHPDTIDRLRDRLARFTELPGETIPELHQMGNVSSISWADGNSQIAADLAERSLGEGRMGADPGAGDSISVYQSAWVLMFTDRHRQASELLEATLADARTRGSAFGFTTSCGMRALAALRRGDLPGAEAEARSGIALPTLPPFVRPPIFSFLALTLVERGELDEAEWAVTESGCGYLPNLVPMNFTFVARGALRLAQGRHEEALADFREVGDRQAALAIGNLSLPWRNGAIEAAIALGRQDEAEHLAAELVEVAERWTVQSDLGAAYRARAMTQADPLPDLERAVEILEPSPARLEHARALVDLGAALRRGGSRAQARDPLRDGLEMARRCGATVLAERAHAELITAGARPRRLMFSGVEGLTASERRVAEMAASGLSNREIAQTLFVTPKTVENHLGRTYGKLGISSRDELPAAFADAPVEA